MIAAGVTLRAWPLDLARRLVAGSGLDAAATAPWHPGYPLADTVDALTMLLAAHEAAGPLAGRPDWWVHEIRVDGQVVGDVGFHGPPAPSRPVVVEIGYAVVPQLRNRGVATRAVGLLLQRAWRDGADQVLAETDEHNLASQAVLRGAGFRRRLCGDWAAARPVRGAA
jgi:RimJ/RimL family protein N-acetyltransferase